MSPSHADIALLQDAVDRTLADPAAQHNWRNLGRRLAVFNDPIVRERVLARLRRHVPTSGIAGFFLAHFLAATTGERKYTGEAARLLMTLKPVNSDRLSAFFHFAHAQCMLTASTNKEFVDMLLDSTLNELAAFLIQNLATQMLPVLGIRLPKQLGRVAIITSYLGNRFHPPTSMAIEHANLLVKSGIEAQIFSCQEMVVPDSDMMLAQGERVRLGRPDPQWWQSKTGAGVRIVHSNEEYSLPRRYNEMLGTIGTYDPDLILFIGLFSVLVSPLYALRPVVGLCTHALQPMAATDVWLTGDEETASRLNDAWHPSFPPCWGWFHPFRVSCVPPTGYLSRDELGLPKQAVVLISVGFRLGQEIRGSWADRMLGFLRDHPDAVWLLVGGSGELPAALPASAGNIIALHAREDIPAILACCDIYANPPRLGGGFSVAEAMAAGLPIVTHTGTDGGNKVGESAVQDDDEYFTLLDRLFSNPAARREQGEAQRQRFARRLDLANSTPSLRGACELAMERFRARISQDPS
jgi:glycosyltransferase involved in cell wall biosynthesis